MKARINLELVQDEDVTHRFNVKDEAGAAFDLTGHTARLQATDKDGTTVLDMSEGASVSTDASGFVDVTFTAAATAAAVWSLADYELFVISGVGAKSLAARGKLLILPTASAF